MDLTNKIREVLRDGKAMSVNEVAELLNKGLSGEDRYMITEIRSELFLLEKHKFVNRTPMDGGLYRFTWKGVES